MSMRGVELARKSLPPGFLDALLIHPPLESKPRGGPQDKPKDTPSSASQPTASPSPSSTSCTFLPGGFEGQKKDRPNP